MSYLANEHDVPINAVFFRVFKDGDREYLSRVWFIDPTVPKSPGPDTAVKEPWNGEFYVSFGGGPHRQWTDAMKYGYISAGGGSWYSKTLSLLEPGNQVWVNVPGQGYVGVGKVIEPVVKVDAFTITKDDGKEVPITDLSVEAPEMFERKDDIEKAEYLVRIEWVKTVPLNKAFKETGFFGNQNSVCKPRTKKWDYTVERLKKLFNVH